eukprot:50890-Chlamydomonas_euryale.AAC.3
MLRWRWCAALRSACRPPGAGASGGTEDVEARRAARDAHDGLGDVPIFAAAPAVAALSASLRAHGKVLTTAAPADPAA